MALEDLSGRMSELAQTGVAKAKEWLDVGVSKTKEFTEIGKLKVENATEQEAIKRAYLEIGKLYFAERGMAPEAPYTALCEKIAASKAKIEYNQERINDIKAASGAGAAEAQDAGLDVEVEVEIAPDAAEAPAEPAAPADEGPKDDAPEA